MFCRGLAVRYLLLRKLNRWETTLLWRKGSATLVALFFQPILGLGVLMARDLDPLRMSSKHVCELDRISLYFFLISAQTHSLPLFEVRRVFSIHESGRKPRLLDSCQTLLYSLLYLVLIQLAAVPCLTSLLSIWSCLPTYLAFNFRHSPFSLDFCSAIRDGGLTWLGLWQDAYFDSISNKSSNFASALKPCRCSKSL